MKQGQGKANKNQLEILLIERDVKISKQKTSTGVKN